MVTTFRLLGPVEGHRDGDQLALGGSKQKTVLAMLLLAQGQTVSTAKIVDAVWGDDPKDGAVSTLRVFMSNLRRAISPDDAAALQYNGDGYRCRFACELDVTKFAERCMLAASTPIADRARPWRQALAMFTEDPLGGLEDTDPIRRERTRLLEARSAALDELFAAELAAGRHHEVLPELFAAAQEHPLRERTWSDLIVALYRSGRQAESLRTYQQFRERLIDELGVEPTPEMRRLEQRILDQSATLDPPPPDVSSVRSPSNSAQATIQTSSSGREGQLDLADGRRIELGHQITTIGRDERADVLIDDLRVSRRHATIRFRRGSYELVDEGSTNGTEANGQPIERHELVSGDVISLGGFTLRFLE